MKKTTEKKALRNITDIRADLETRANAYNAAINADDTKAAELEKLDNETSELEKEYTRAAFHATALELLDNPAPMLAAATALTFETLKHKDKEDENGIKSREIVTAERPLDFVALESFFVERGKKFGADVKTVAEKFATPTQARDIDLGKTPTSNTQLLKQLQMIIDSMLYVEGEKGNIYKANSHDVGYLLSLYAKKGRGVLSVAAARPKYLEKLITEILHRIVTEKSYNIEFKEKKDRASGKIDPKPAGAVESARKSAKKSSVAKQNKSRKKKSAIDEAVEILDNAKSGKISDNDARKALKKIEEEDIKNGGLGFYGIRLY